MAEMASHCLHLREKTAWEKPKGSTVWRNNCGGTVSWLYTVNLLRMVKCSSLCITRINSITQLGNSGSESSLPDRSLLPVRFCHTKTTSTHTQRLYSADSECSEGRSGLACLVYRRRLNRTVGHKVVDLGVSLGEKYS